MEGVTKVLAFARSYAEACAHRLQKNPRDPDALFTSAAIAAVLDRNEEAVTALDRLSQVAPHYPGVWWLKARVFHELGNGRMELLCLAAARNEGPSDGRPPRVVRRARASRSEVSARAGPHELAVTP